MSKYLTYEERLQIEAGLKENLSFGAIGRQIDKDRTTIAEEIKKHSCEKNQCRRPSTTYCKLCSYCNDFCPDFEEEVCSVPFKPPYVCNGCG